MTPAGLEPAIPGSVGRCLIHWATGPDACTVHAMLNVKCKILWGYLGVTLGWVTLGQPWGYSGVTLWGRPPADGSDSRFTNTLNSDCASCLCPQDPL